MTKTILITGCSTGIGLTCARGLKARGWRVFATARRYARRESEVEDIVHVAGAYLERFSERTGIATKWLPAASSALRAERNER